MICPNCQKETPSLIDHCEHCKTDLHEFNMKREENIRVEGLNQDGSNNRWTLITMPFVVLVGIVWSFLGYKYGHRFLRFPMGMIIIGFALFVAALFSKTTWGKKRKMPHKLENNGK